MVDDRPGDSAPAERRLKSCGIFIMRRQPTTSFLLMKHANRWDIPKGHVDPGETELVCAFRELEEETGIMADEVQRDMTFRYTTSYYVRDKRTKGKRVHKMLVVFLAWLEGDVEIKPTEHEGYEWMDWAPPHRIQEQAIDPLLASVAEHLSLD